jgi:hypothetical protein
MISLTFDGNFGKKELNEAKTTTATKTTAKTTTTKEFLNSKKVSFPRIAKLYLELFFLLQFNVSSFTL